LPPALFSSPVRTVADGPPVTGSVTDVSCWQVHRYDFARWKDRPAELDGYPGDLESWVGAFGERDGQRFLIGPDGRPDERVNMARAIDTIELPARPTGEPAPRIPRAAEVIEALDLW
jgi:hypothetical protein